jgi:DNA excision repair protein ERCC-2
MIKKVLFPYSKIRKIQDNLISEVYDTIKNKKNMVVHAPTGLGKTVATLGPALSIAVKNDLTVFFLTSRHTQHIIAINTLKAIKKKYDLDFTSCDIIGRKWMCPVEGIDKLYANDFDDYCKTQREENKCEFYSNTIKRSGRVTVKAKQVLQAIKQLSPCHTEKIFSLCNTEKLCPYEMSALLARDSKVIVCDYYYVFHPSISDSFFKKANKKLTNSIIIIDEGHNLPLRVRDLMTEKLSSFIIKRAISEAKKFKFEETASNLKILGDILVDIGIDLNEKKKEKLVKKDEFVNLINFVSSYDELITDFIFTGDEIRDKQRHSYVGSIAHFLENWLGYDLGFARIISKDENSITLSYRCLDPSLLTKSVVNNTFSTLIMSGTLTPTFMYKDILGFNNETLEKEFKSPFPKKNRLSLIIPETTTKFTKRNEKQFIDIAKICSKVIDNVPGNCAVFFPSYNLRNSVYTHLKNYCNKIMFLEESNLNK